jgi:ethanolamine utilization protein EutA
MDIGGGTSNLAWIRDGKILATGCLNVGGRLVKLDERGTITYVSPVLRGLTGLEPGQQPEVRELEALAELLTQALEMAAGLRPATELLNKLTTEHPFQFQPAAEGMVVSFSGGVADCIGQERQNFVFGDLGPILGKAIRKSRLCQSFILGEHTIRATVIGAGCHSTRLSGSTVFYRGISFPVRNLPVASVSDPTAQAVRAAVGIHDTTPILALPELSRLSYGALSNLAGELVKAVPQGPIYLSARQDMAKALGQALALRTDRPVLCLDRLELSQGSFLDVNPPVGPALPVVIKSLVFTP